MIKQFNCIIEKAYGVSGIEDGSNVIGSIFFVKKTCNFEFIIYNVFSVFMFW